MHIGHGGGLQNELDWIEGMQRDCWVDGVHVGKPKPCQYVIPSQGSCGQLP